MRVKPWSHMRWGVMFEIRGEASSRHLIGRLWTNYGIDIKFPDHEPSRALLFLSRAQARAWCQAKNRVYRGYPKGHICRGWRMRVVRVRETVQVVA